MITNLEDAQEAPLPEAQKMGVLRGMMVAEQRLNLTQAFNWACLNSYAFENVLNTMMSMWNNILYKSAVTSSGEEKICFRFQQGNYTAKNCIHVHKIMTEQQKKDLGYDKNNKKDKVKDKKLDKNKIKNSLNSNSSGTNGMHNNSNNDHKNAIPLTKEHYMSIGEPRGKKSDENPRGYSKSQIKLFNAFVMIHNTPSNDNNDNNICWTINDATYLLWYYP